MADNRATVVSQKSLHHGHRDLVAAFFREHPHQIVSWELLEQLVGRNYQQRVSDARRELGMNLENVPRFDAAGKRLTGDYCYRPHALGRDAATVVSYADSHLGPLFDRPGAFQR